MSRTSNSLYNLRLMDELAQKNTVIHNIHPMIKLLTTILYLGFVVSFNRYELSGLLPFLFYPVLLITLAEIPVIPVIKRVLMVEPLIIGIGILNPFIDQEKILLLDTAVSRGWITFLSMILKCSLSVMAALLLVSTTGMDKIASSLRMMKIPRLFVLQLLLVYRYISVLLEEVSRTLKAYFLRAPGQKGVHRKIWGTLAGQLILRTFERAERIYQAMCIRGFKGEYNLGALKKLSLKDGIYLLSWGTFFIAARIYNIPVILGDLMGGLAK
ncbi:MAG: cobalt ECF transporter T component CbiQ [Clostridia bacterium]|nr:cobalt ECF transporter T component CbiQ [Clostridia bacterium]